MKSILVALLVGGLSEISASDTNTISSHIRTLAFSADGFNVEYREIYWKEFRAEANLTGLE